MAGIMLCSLMFTSCINTELDEDVQLYQNLEELADDTGGGDDNPLPIPPPPSKIGG